MTAVTPHEGREPDLSATGIADEPDRAASRVRRRRTCRRRMVANAYRRTVRARCGYVGSVSPDIPVLSHPSTRRTLGRRGFIAALQALDDDPVMFCDCVSGSQCTDFAEPGDRQLTFTSSRPSR